MVILASIAAAAYKNPNSFSTVKTEVKQDTSTGSADGDWDVNITDSCAENSTYITATKLLQPFPYVDQIDKSFPETCTTINPNYEENGLLIVLGDSRADMSKTRFLKLFDVAKKTNATFPTIVFKTRLGRAMLLCPPEFPANMEMLKT
ncbi:hypothetical protein THRCLA_23159, partial [Thraustotheca clavata]